jgi:hypothetical protein
MNFWAKTMIGFSALSALPAMADIVQFGIGRKTPAVDGAVADGEYGAFVPYMYEIDGYMAAEDLPYSERSPESYFAWDDKAMYFAMVSEGANLKATVTERDGPVYNDDSVDFYLSHNSSRSPMFHFIFNSLGAMYDAKNDDKSWNSEGVRIASKVFGGKWTLEVAVPWSVVGFSPEGTVFAPHLNLCRTYRSGQSSSVKFIDLDENYSVGLAHGPFAARKTHALVFLREKVSAVGFPELKPPRPGENARRQMVSLKEPGNPKEIVFWGMYPLLSRDPVTFRFVTSDIKTKTMLFCTENNFPKSENYFIDLDFRDRETGTVSVMKLSGEAAKMRGQVQQRFDVSRLPDGEYRLFYEIKDGEGKVIASDYTYYGKYGENPPWKDCAAGSDDTTPAPWTDPVFRRDSFECWGRTVRFGGAGLVSSMVTQGRELLASPVRLLVDGKAARWRVVSSERHVSFADYVLAPEGVPASGAVQVKVRAEFDGYMWFDVVRPRGCINSMKLEIPVVRSEVVGFDDGSSVIEKLSLPEGASGSWTFDPRENPFFWLGNGSVGLMGGTENRRGWNLKDVRKGYVLQVDGKTAKVTVNFVDAPSETDGTVAVGFYLNPTPVRPKNVALEQFDPSKMCRWTGHVAKFCDMKKPGELRMDVIERFKKRQANGEKVFWYQGSAIASPYSPLWAWYGGEWNFTGNPSTVYLEIDPKDRSKRDRGGWIWGCLGNKSFFDYRMWSADWFLNHPDCAVSNLYFDISFPKSCRNAAHGCNNEYFFRGMREFHKRIYRQLKKKNPDGAMLGHVRFVRTPADNFFDESWCGEAYEIQVAKKHNYYDLLNPEAMQIHYASRAMDMVMAISCQIYRTYQVYCPKELPNYDPYTPDADRAIRHAAAYFKIHNLLITVRPEETFVGRQWWQAESYAHFLGSDRKFSAYYLRDCPVSVDSPERLFLYAASWNGKGEAALVILNDTDGVAKKRLSVDTERIGLRALKGRDIFSGRQYSLEGGSFEVELGPRESAYVKFSE